MKNLTPVIIVITIVLLLCIMTALSSFYTVNASEIAVITRLGKYHRKAEPGLNFKIPYIEKAAKVSTEEQLKQEFGYRTIVAGVKTEYHQEEKEREEASMVTADLNIIHIEWEIHYRIEDPVKYLFKVNNPIETLRVLSLSTMSKIAGDYLFDEIITVAKEEISEKMKNLLQSEINKLNIGISIEGVNLKNVIPPAEIKDAYDKVFQAQKEKERIIDEAKKLFNEKVIPVKGEAERILAEARAYKQKRTRVARGEAEYFNKLYKEYQTAPDITKKRIYLETLSEVLPNFKDIYIVDESQKNLLPLLQLQNK